MEQILRAAICALNSKYIHSALAPWNLLAGIEAHGDPDIVAEVIEGTINEEPEDILPRILATHPRVIGFSCYIWNISATRKLVRLVKEALPESIIVLGGPEVSYNAAAILREEPAVQYVISGEGELPFALLLQAIKKGEQAWDIPGVSYRQDGRIVTNPQGSPGAEPPSPYSPKYLAALNGRIAYLETSRGCPYSCAFCLSGFGRVRYFNLERAKEELLLLANSGTQTVKLVDRTFNARRSRAVELFRFIIDNYGHRIPSGVHIHFEIAGDLLDDETIDLLARAPAGAIQFEIGLQSFNSETLAAINRKTDLERLQKNVRRLVENGNIHIHLDLIAGLPYEDLASFAESFNTAYKLRPHMLQLGFLKLLHGSQMRVEPEKYPCVYEDEPPYEVRETPWLSAAELRYLKGTEEALERLYNSGRFRRTLEYLFGQLKLEPFELFGQFGQYLAARGTYGMPLDNFLALILEYFGTQAGIDRITLRDKLVCDFLATNASGSLPAVLRIEDPALNRIKKNLQRKKPVQRVRRGLAILYSIPFVVYVDYQDKNPVTGEYALNFVEKKDSLMPGIKMSPGSCPGLRIVSARHYRCEIIKLWNLWKL